MPVVSIFTFLFVVAAVEHSCADDITFSGPKSYVMSNNINPTFNCSISNVPKYQLTNFSWIWQLEHDAPSYDTTNITTNVKCALLSDVSDSFSLMSDSSTNGYCNLNVYFNGGGMDYTGTGRFVCTVAYYDENNAPRTEIGYAQLVQIDMDWTAFGDKFQVTAGDTFCSYCGLGYTQYVGQWISVDTIIDGESELNCSAGVMNDPNNNYCTLMEPGLCIVVPDLKHDQSNVSIVNCTLKFPEEFTYEPKSTTSVFVNYCVVCTTTQEPITTIPTAEPWATQSTTKMWFPGEAPPASTRSTLISLIIPALVASVLNGVAVIASMLC